MGKRIFISLGLACVFTLPSFAAIITNENYSFNAENLVQITNYMSKHVKITGTICSSNISDNSKVLFLNFGNNFNTSLSAVIYDFDFHAFIDAGINKPDTYFKNKKVELNGIVRLNNGKPEIVLNSPKQIKILEN